MAYKAVQLVISDALTFIASEPGVGDRENAREQLTRAAQDGALQVRTSGGRLMDRAEFANDRYGELGPWSSNTVALDDLKRLWPGGHWSSAADSPPTINTKACRDWLQAEIVAGRIAPKAEMYVRAAAHFPGLTRKAFLEHVWAQVATDDMKKRGRKSRKQPAVVAVATQALPKTPTRRQRTPRQPIAGTTIP